MRRGSKARGRKKRKKEEKKGAQPGKMKHVAEASEPCEVSEERKMHLPQWANLFRLTSSDLFCAVVLSFLSLSLSLMVDVICFLCLVCHVAMKGDSGGPLTITTSTGQSVVIGIVSFGFKCAQEYPGVYVATSNYISWINTIIKDSPRAQRNRRGEERREETSRHK